METLSAGFNLRLTSGLCGLVPSLFAMVHIILQSGDTIDENKMKIRSNSNLYNIYTVYQYFILYKLSKIITNINRLQFSPYSK